MDEAQPYDSVQTVTVAGHLSAEDGGRRTVDGGRRTVDEDGGRQTADGEYGDDGRGR